MKYKTGSTYTGEFKDGKKNGQGTMKYKNGDTYTGEFKTENFMVKAPIFTMVAKNYSKKSIRSCTRESSKTVVTTAKEHLP